MSTGAYLPRWINCSTEAGQVRALVFVMNRDNPAYIRAPARAGAAGHRASSAATAPAPNTWCRLPRRAAGIHDSRLDAIARRLEADSHALLETA